MDPGNDSASMISRIDHQIRENVRYGGEGNGRKKFVQMQRLAQGSPETIMNWAKDINQFESKLVTEKRYGTMVDGTRDKEDFVGVKDKVDMADLTISNSLHDKSLGKSRMVKQMTVSGSRNYYDVANVSSSKRKN